MTATTDERIEALEARLTEVEAENDELRDRVDKVEKRAEKAEQERDELRERLDEVETSTTKNSHAVEHAHDRVDEVETTTEKAVEYAHNRLDRVTGAGSGDENPTPEGVKTGPSASNSGKTPLEQITNYTQPDADEHLSANEQRARVIAMDVQDYATTTPKGLVVSSSDVRKVMTARDEDTHDETISRIMDYLDDFGRDEVTTKVHKGKRIAVFDKEPAKRYGNGPRPKSQGDVIRQRARG